MINVNDILESGCHFSADEVLLKFRFRLLNTVMLTIVVVASLFGVMHYLGLNDITDFHANVNFLFAFCNALLALYLRKSRTYFRRVLYMVILSSLLTFTSALVIVTEDSFRIIWFYILILIAFVAGGKKEGYITALLSAMSILVSTIFVDLHLNEVTLTTALVGMVVFVLSMKYYVDKIESIEEAMNTLNASLSAKVDEKVEELHKQELVMIQQARLAQMGEMIAMIAHQWRQPLSSISAITSNMKISLAMGEELSEQMLQDELDSIDARVELLSQTINDFRNFYTQNGHKQRFDITELLQQSIDVLSPALSSANVKIELNSLVKRELYSYESEIIQVFMNIIKNAIDVLKDKEGRRHIVIDAYEDKEHVYIQIEDNGGGIDEAIIDKVFDPYFSTKKEKNGMGLGMYMSHIIIKEHCKGEIGVENSLAGALFTIKLPFES